MGIQINLHIDIAGKKDYPTIKPNISYQQVITYIEKMTVSDELKKKLIKRALDYPEGSLRYFLEKINDSIR